MSTQLDYFKNLIEEKGYKFTFQKKIILKTLMESSIHLNVEEIYNKIKKNNIGIATVYRNLKVFKKTWYSEGIEYQRCKLLRNETI